MSDKTPFERTIQEKLEGYEAPYDPSAWEGIEAELDRTNPSQGRSGKKAKKSGKWGAIAVGSAAVLLGGGLLVNELSQKEEGNAEEKAPEKTLVEQHEKNSKGSSSESEKTSPEGEEKTSSAPSSKVSEGKKDEKASEERAEDETGPNNDKLPEGESPERSSSSTTDNSSKKTDSDKGTDNDIASLSPEERDKEKNPIPADLAIHTGRTDACPGLDVNFELSQAPEGVNYFWKFGDGSFSNKAAPSHRFKEAGTYRVSVTLTHQESGKTRKITAENPIRVHQNPNAKIEVQETPRQLRRAHRVTVLELEDRANVKHAVWDLGDGTRVDDQERIVHQYPSKGLYTVKVYLFGEDGCRDTVRFRHEQNKSYDRTLLAPNAFAPNNDGHNDRFIPKALEVLERPFTMTIHDRSGRMVYKTRDASEPWNGRVQNSGQELDEGVYLWVVVIENKKGEEETYKGAVTLKR